MWLKSFETCTAEFADIIGVADFLLSCTCSDCQRLVLGGSAKLLTQPHHKTPSRFQESARHRFDKHFNFLPPGMLGPMCKLLFFRDTHSNLPILIQYYPIQIIKESKVYLCLFNNHSNSCWEYQFWSQRFSRAAMFKST